jgi:3-methyl-2-oxobutanoate hydroxymethyltransferase
VKPVHTAVTVHAMKREGNKIVSLTAYDYNTARILDAAGVDVLLVGDSAATVIYGHETTLSADMPAMLGHVEAVARGTKRALVVGDMPFLSYQTGEADAIRSAGEMLRAGAGAVKLEGGKPMARTVRRIVETGIPVMGHIGLTPQSVRAFGGYPLTGKTDDAAERLIADAVLLEEAGCFSLVLEKVHRETARRVTETVSIPTIGIGSGPDCDGQVLVTQDMLGLTEFEARFVRRYADVGGIVRDAAERYAEDVREGRFPSDDESFGRSKGSV